MGESHVSSAEVEIVLFYQNCSYLSCYLSSSVSFCYQQWALALLEVRAECCVLSCSETYYIDVTMTNEISVMKRGY